MKIAIACGLSDHKLSSILKPLSALGFIDGISLIRHKKLDFPGIVSLVPPVIIRSILPLREVCRCAVLFYLCLAKKVDYLVGIHFRMHCVYVGVLGCVFNLPYCMMIIEDPKKYHGSAIFRYFVQKADKVSVRGEISKQYLINQCKADTNKIFVLPDVIDLNGNITGEKEYDFIFIGNMVQEKRPDVLIDIFDALKKKGLSFKAAILGQGPLANQVQKKINTCALESHVEFLGHQDNVFDYLKRSKYLLMTSQTEGLPVVILESYSCGVPVIVPDIADISDVVQDGQTGFVVERLDFDQYCAVCEKALKDDSVYETLAKGVCDFRIKNSQRYTQQEVTDIWQGALNKS